MTIKPKTHKICARSLSSVLCLLFSILCVVAHAEVVYLKNGTVIKGRLVAKSDKYIVISSGEPLAPVRSTIFLEDINKMLTDEEYEKEPLSAHGAPLPGLFEAKRQQPVYEKDFLISTVPRQESRSHIKQLLRQEEEYRSTSGPEGLVEGRGFLEEEYTSQGLTKEEVDLRLKETAFAQKKGRGAISGTVSLPAVQDAKGSLYVYLLEDAGDGLFIGSEKMLFDKVVVPAAKTPYKIKNVPEGKYKVFAEWDIAKPDVKIEKAGLMYLGAQGDYTGSTQDVITLGVDESRENVDFSCNTFVEKDLLEFDWGEKPSFRIKDIYYVKSFPDEQRFYIIIQNLSKNPIPMLPLDIYINDKKVFSYPWKFTDIPALGEKEFDISGSYKGYLNISKEQENSLKFKVEFPESRDVEFEKTIYIFP